MNCTYRTICLALLAGILAGAAAATYLLAVDVHGKVGLEFDARNARQHVEPGHVDANDEAARALKFWGLKVGYGDSLTAIGVYSGRTSRGATHVAPAHPTRPSPRLPE
jgi:hypothetical protein